MYNLFLSERQEALSPLEVEITVRYTVLEEKFAGRTVFLGRFVKLSTREAELHTENPLALLSNLKIQFIKNNGEVMEGDLFAKVLGNPTNRSTCFLVRFTSMPPEVKVFLQDLLSG